MHLIADEIAVGCGRTGTFFAWEHVSPRSPGTAPAPRGGLAAHGSGPAGGSSPEIDWPDFMLLSKGITGGTMALSLVLTTDEVFEAFWSEDVTRGFLHSHSYTGNPLACRVACAVLDIMERDGIAQRAAQLGERLLAVRKSDGESTLPFFTGYLLSFEYLKDVAEVLGDALTAGGKYFLFCNNIDLSRKYQVPYQGAMFYVLPIDEATVYNELLELLVHFPAGYMGLYPYHCHLVEHEDMGMMRPFEVVK